MQFTVVLMGLVASVLATPNANAEPAVTPAAELEARQMEIGGGLAGTLGPGEATAGGAINGPTGFVQGCLGGAFVSEGTTACFPVATAPAKTNTKSVPAGGNAHGTLGPASGFLDSDGLCGGAAVGNNGFTTCLIPTKSA